MPLRSVGFSLREFCQRMGGSAVCALRETASLAGCRGAGTAAALRRRTTGIRRSYFFAGGVAGAGVAAALSAP